MERAVVRVKDLERVVNAVVKVVMLKRTVDVTMSFIGKEKNICNGFG
jgi:hypothetical protein